MEQPPIRSNGSTGLPNEVRDVIYEAALREDYLRSNGVRPERISRLAHIPMNQALARLALQRVDTRLAFIPEKPEVSSSHSDSEVSDEIFAAAERLMETTGWSYDDAIREAKRRAK